MTLPPIYLASSSPRRVDLLTMLGIPFEQIVQDVDETNHQAADPVDIALHNSQLKVQAVLDSIRNGYVIGADTIVVLDRIIYGKPSSPEQAIRFLSALSGKTHQVITGVTIGVGGSNLLHSDFALTRVTFRDLSRQEIETYVSTGECNDKAGAYAVQGRGALFISSIQGCYSNVIGLPLVIMNALFEKAGISLYHYWQQ